MVLATMVATRNGVKVCHGMNRQEVLATLSDVESAERWAEDNGYFFTTGRKRERKAVAA